MTSDSTAARSRAKTTYDSAADTYDDPANTFWTRFGQRTIDRLAIARGERVLDACCGSGASALPAAERVGPSGAVRGIDLSHRLIALARAKAQVGGLANVEFFAGDVADIADVACYDTVVCVFGIFFLPDMPAGLRALWRAVKPGGRLAITTWGPGFLEPASGAFWQSIRNVRPDLYRGFNPWDRITTPSALVALLQESGIASAQVDAESGLHPISSPTAWWAAVMGSGYRGTVDQLDAEDYVQVHGENLAFIRDRDISQLEVNVVYAIATKPQGTEIRA